MRRCHGRVGRIVLPGLPYIEVMRKSQDCAQKGSQKWLQVLVNDCPQLLEQTLVHQLNLPSNQFHWLSPCRGDQYAEYSDNEFISRLGLAGNLKVSLKSFWPKGGPVWDGLGKTDQEQILLVEAKAHIPELHSPPTRAKSQSALTIRKSLEDTKQFIGSQSNADWSTCFYQYTNRLAHLYFLRELNCLPAFLIFLYFLNDTVMNGPTTQAEWESAIQLQERHLGIRPQHKLSKYTIHAFVDIRRIP